MRRWCVVALGVSVLITVGAALWNVPPAEDDGNGANIGAALLLLFGVFSTIVSVFCVLGSSSAAEVRDVQGGDDDDVKTAWPRP